MLIYVPTPITSAEQAEKLPAWTVAVPPDKGLEPMWKCECGYWETDGHDRRDAFMIGWTALVPVEAEEEHDTDCVDVPGGRPIRRLVTRWDDA